MTTLYLADVGFRAAGVRLAMPVRVASGERKLTLDELIATPDGTELTYDVSGLTGDEGYTSKQDVVAISAGGAEQLLERGSFSFGTAPAGLRRRLSSTSVIPQHAGPIEIAITIQGVGEFRVSARVRPFGPDTDAPRRDVNMSAAHEGITVTVRGIGAAREETAVEVEVNVGEGECCRGIGGLDGHRLGLTALTLRDESGRVYRERWQQPRVDDATLALFEPLEPGARELELAVPYVFVEEPVTTQALPLPIGHPVEAQLGRYQIRLLAAARVEADPRARVSAYREPALGIDLDLGGWHGDRRVLLPGRVLVDGGFSGVGYRMPGLMNSSSPESLDRLELFGDGALTARTLAFAHPCIQVRGPWRIGFSLDK